MTNVVATRLYGPAAITVTSFSATGNFANGETFSTSDLTGSPGVTTPATATSPIGTYYGTANIGSISSTNYNITFDPGNASLTITPGPPLCQPPTSAATTAFPIPSSIV